MKRLWVILFLISFICGQETQYERRGDPEDLSSPGGYIGISYEFDLKTKQKGLSKIDIRYNLISEFFG